MRVWYVSSQVRIEGAPLALAALNRLNLDEKLCMGWRAISSKWKWAFSDPHTLAENYLAALIPLKVQEELRETTPEEFARRNVFCGSEVYCNKYERTRIPRRIA